MKLWLKIRRPVGYLLATLLGIGVLIVMHAIPELFARLLTNYWS